LNTLGSTTTPNLGVSNPREWFVTDLALAHGAREDVVEPSGVQALKNPNPLKDVEGLAVLVVAELS